MKFIKIGKLAIRFHHPFKINEFNDWFLINVGLRVGKLKGIFIIIFNSGIEIYVNWPNS